MIWNIDSSTINDSGTLKFTSGSTCYSNTGRLNNNSGGTLEPGIDFISQATQSAFDKAVRSSERSRSV